MDYDKEKLLRIISNLLSNAIRFTPEGGDVYLTVHSREQTEEGAFLVVKIRDTGPGIPADQLPYIFDRFYQAPQPPGRGETAS